MPEENAIFSRTWVEEEDENGCCRKLNFRVRERERLCVCKRERA